MQLLKVKDMFDIKITSNRIFIIITVLLVVNKLVTDKLINDSNSYFQN